MGFLNATLADPESAARDFAHALAAGESVRIAFKMVRDTILFTDKRVIMIDVQGVTGSKKRYTSIPYRAISSFSLESAGHFDLDTEFTMTLSGSPPVTLKLSRGADVNALQTHLIDRMAK
ncbi:MAG: PH domain-containing protein [Sphingomonadaceae bacterium]